MGAFGDKFRKAREAKGISLDDVSNVTKISSRNLKAIEEERFDLLPGGVFNRGFIRAYAKHLGLNDEEAVSDYLECLRQAQIDAHEVWTPEPVAPARTSPPVSSVAVKRPPYQKPAVKLQSPPPTPVHGDEELPGLQLPRAEHVRPPRQKYLDGRSPGVSWQLIAAAALVVVLAGILWLRHSRATHTDTAHAAPRATATSVPVPAAASSNLSPQMASASAPAKPNSTAPTNAPSANKPVAPTNGNPQPNSADKAPTGATNPPPANQAAEKDDSDVTVRTFTKPAVPVKAAPTMTLVIRASETSWISVTADGQQVSQETLIAPAHASIRASREIVARIGNSGGVSFLFNGQEIAAQGTESEVKTFVFDANGMREVPNQPPVR